MSTSKRAQYLSGELTFREYYGLLVEYLGEDSLRLMLPVTHTPDEWRELIAADQHLNNVSLRKWDVRDPLVRGLISLRDRNELVAITGSTGWALSDSVCVLKETARRYAEHIDNRRKD